MSDNITVRDSAGNAVTMKTVDVGGVHTPVHRISGYDSLDDMVKVKSIQKKMRDSFVSALTTQWDVTQVNGSTATVAGGVLTMASGTNAGGYAEVISKEIFTIPFRAMFGLLNTRNANNHHIIEAVSVDPITGIPDGISTIAMDIGGAASMTATQMLYWTQNGGLVPLVSAAVTIGTTASLSILELEPFSDEAYFHSRAMDATTGRANSYVRHQQIPDPNAVYKLRIRTMNFGVFKGVTAAVAGTGNVIRLTSTAHGYATSNVLWVEGLQGVTNNGAAVRGPYTITVVDANTIELQGTVFAGTYVATSGRVALAAAPAAVSMQLQFANCQDYAELTAEITAGRGQIVEGQAIAARMVSGSVATVSGTVTANAVAQDNMFYNESVTPQAASATLTGTMRDVGIAAAAAHRFSRFNAMVLADQTGTMRIEVSNDNVTWRRATLDTAVAINTPVLLSVPVMTRYHRVVYVNGATLQTVFMLNTSYTAT